MKKIFTLAMAALFGAGMASAQSATMITRGDVWYLTGGEMGLCISDNGRYIAGSTIGWNGFIYDTETDVTRITPEEVMINPTGATLMYCVTDDGVAYGADPENGAVTLSISGDFTIFDGTDSRNLIVAVRGVSADGSVAAGFRCPDWTNMIPCLWINGERKDLEAPTSKDAGFLIRQGTRAIGVSSDGNVILGEVVASSINTTMVFWVRQEDGSYKYVDAFKGKYDGEYTNITDETGKIVSVERGPYPYSLFHPVALSRDGKTVLMELRGNTPDLYPPLRMGFYDVATGEVTEIPYTEDNFLYSDGYFELQGLSNEGTVVGMVGHITEGPVPVIIYADDYDNALTLPEAFPTVGLIQDFQKQVVDKGDVYVLSSIAPDDSRFVAYGILATDVDPGYWSYATYYCETGRSNGVKGVGDELTEIEGPAEYYTISGVKVQNPGKGIYIVRDANGKSYKVVR